MPIVPHITPFEAWLMTLPQSFWNVMAFLGGALAVLVLFLVVYEWGCTDD